MALHADTLLDRIYLKSQVRRWRILAIVAVAAAVILIVDQAGGKKAGGALPINYIARLSVEGVMLDDPKRDELLDEIKEDSRVKALIVRMDTPGGTAVAGEELYLKLRDIAKEKPVVAVMRTMSASAGYMAALGADYIIARSGTLTGSIGVLMQTGEFTELAKKLGIELITVKSGPLKATPSPFEKFTPEQEAAAQQVIDGFYEYFVGLIVERRKLPREEVLKLADGRVYTGQQALNHKLIDALGGEDEAIAWLASAHKIDSGLDVKDIEVKRETGGIFQKLSDYAGKSVLSEVFVKQRGLLLMWDGALKIE